MKINAKTSVRLVRLAILLLLTTSIAHAQLALIRQGRESVGVMEEGDFHGDAVALGDFNGDGWDDLATGAPLEKTGSPTFSSGFVTINWGTPHGLTWLNAIGLSVIDGSYDPAKNSQMGRALAVGDFNADGFDDLAVGLPAAEVSGESAAGAVFVYYGSKGGLPGVADVIHQGQLGAAVESGDVFGSALAAGKIGNDQYDDLVIGSPGENTTAGAVFIVRGGALGLNTAQRQIILASDLGSTSSAGERFGDAVAVGDVVGLANEDLIIGAPFSEITPSASGSGRAFVVIGNNNGVALNNVLELTPLTVGDSLFLQGNFGSAFAIGDLWGDGAPHDLVIGAPGAHAGGRAYVGRGSPFGITWPVALAQDGSDSANDNFGSAMAIGDHDDDGFDDLAVGNPGEDSLFGLNTGAVHIFPGSNSGAAQANVTTYYEFNLGDNFGGQGRLGSSLAAGRTSASPRHSFVAGAPYKNNNRGQVYDIAPWRQVLNLACRSALAADCENNIVYALKPFDRLKIASTTKIMTVLLGCEATTRSVGDPLHVALNETYTIEDWMYDGFPLTSGCSTFGFTPLPIAILTENYTFNELLRICFPPSGNDVCYAIADKMTGEVTDWSGHATTAPVFVQLMNDRAAQIGMNGTLFTNPAGVDSANPYSTAYDMWLLALEAMENPLFRDIANSTDFIVDKLLGVGEVGIYQSFNVNASYGWLDGMKTRDSRIVGIKPGSTPGAKFTGVVAAEISPITKRLAHANGFGWDDGVYSGDRLAELVQLGMSFCNTDFGDSPSGITGLPGPITHQQWNANDETRQAIQFGSFDSTPETNTPASGDGHSEWIDVITYNPVSGSGNSRFRIGWQYRALWELAPGAQAGLTVGPANIATGYFRNITAEEAERSGDATLTLISTSTGSAPQTVLLDSGDQYKLPDWTAPSTSGAEWTIYVQNIGTETVYIAFVGEYQFVPAFSGIAGEFFRAHLHPIGKSVRDGHTIYEDEPIEGAPIFPVEMVVENRVDGMRFLPPMKINSFSIEPASPTHNDWSIQFESVLDPSPPLNAFYSAFDIETSRDLGSWSKVQGLEVTPAISYDWTGELPRGGTLFLRTRGQPAD